MKVTAAVVDQLDGPFRLEQLDLDEPGPGEALVKIVASGICHTDAITRHGDLPMPFPGVLGTRAPAWWSPWATASPRYARVIMW
jgi:aryl-alcohol dehydrogenase